MSGKTTCSVSTNIFSIKLLVISLRARATNREATLLKEVRAGIELPFRKLTSSISVMANGDIRLYE